jgi:hypothetical protein
MVASVAAPSKNAAVRASVPYRLADGQRLRNGLSASTEKPSSLGSWLISTVSAMPFM